jgi:PAS domain S-box-containing protein
MTQIFRNMNQLESHETILQDVSRFIVNSIGFDGCWIGLVNASEELLEGADGYGMRFKNDWLSVTFPMVAGSKNPAIQAIAEKQLIACPTLDDVPEGECKTWLEQGDIKSLIFAPIYDQNDDIGVIGVFYHQKKDFKEIQFEDLKNISAQSAFAIKSAKIYKKMKKSEERYRKLFEVSGTSLVILDERQQFRLVNSAFEELSGYSKSMLEGKMELKPFLTGRQKNLAEILKKLQNPPQNWETEFTDKEGTRKMVHINTTRISGESDILVSITDMTRERELERRLFRSEELAAIGELSAGIAHEIRNPLVAITTSVNLLKDETEISQEGNQLLDVVKEEADHLAVIVDDFLRFARPKQPSFQPEDMNKLLNDVITRSFESALKKFEWIEKYDQKLPTVFLDRHQIQQVITNLVNNSFDAMEEQGTLTVETHFKKRTGEDCAVITIRDTGMGIPKDEISKIFQPFYSMKERGTGMGLAICQRIITAHEGEIFVDSEVDKGTSFTVMLPVKQKINDLNKG